MTDRYPEVRGWEASLSDGEVVDKLVAYIETNSVSGHDIHILLYEAAMKGPVTVEQVNATYVRLQELGIFKFK